MEVLNNLIRQQEALEDAFKLEAEPEDIKQSKLCKQTYNYLKRRRKVITHFINTMSKFENVRSC